MAASPRPTIVNAGRPGRTSTSTVTGLVSRPSMEKVWTRASMTATVGGEMCRRDAAL
jgi:hypothetical protein